MLKFLLAELSFSNDPASEFGPAHVSLRTSKPWVTTSTPTPTYSTPHPHMILPWWTSPPIFYVPRCPDIILYLGRSLSPGHAPVSGPRLDKGTQWGRQDTPVSRARMKIRRLTACPGKLHQCPVCRRAGELQKNKPVVLRETSPTPLGIQQQSFPDAWSQMELGLLQTTLAIQSKILFNLCKRTNTALRGLEIKST